MTMLDQANATTINPEGFARWQTTRVWAADLVVAGMGDCFDGRQIGYAYDGGFIADQGEGAEFGRYSVPIESDEHTTDDLAEAERVLFALWILYHTPDYTQGDYRYPPTGRQGT